MGNCLSNGCCSKLNSVSVSPLSPDQAPMACEACATKFSLIRRKWICSECSHEFCSSCITREKTMSKKQRCQRCIILFSVPLDRNALMGLRIRDLRWYLRKKSISIQTCKEKTDLVDLIMGQSASAPSNLPMSRYSTSTYVYRASTLCPPTHFDQPQASSAFAEPVEEPMEWEAAPEPATMNPPASSSAPPSPYVAAHRHRTSSAKSQSMPASPQNVPSDLVTIDDIKKPEDIAELSVRQLKLILTRNFVGYKGCCEKHELQEKVTWLWKQKQAHKNIDLVPDENLCKICMEAAIECVLLECGHMATCVQCGKRLTECPICRQYVARVVHTFKV